MHACANRGLALTYSVIRSSPYHAEDRSAIIVRLSKANPLTPDTTNESGDEDGYTMKAIVMRVCIYLVYIFIA